MVMNIDGTRVLEVSYVINGKPTYKVRVENTEDKKDENGEAYDYLPSDCGVSSHDTPLDALSCQHCTNPSR
jgi:hypothetical protein